MRLEIKIFYIHEMMKWLLKPSECWSIEFLLPVYLLYYNYYFYLFIYYKAESSAHMIR